MTYADLYHKVMDQPFKPFQIKMANDSAIDVCEPGMMLIGRTSAVLATETARDRRGVRYALDWKTVSISEMVELRDIKSKRHPETEQ